MTTHYAVTGNEAACIKLTACRASVVIALGPCVHTDSESLQGTLVCDLTPIPQREGLQDAKHRSSRQLPKITPPAQ